MTLQPSPYDLIRAIQDQQRATDRLVQMLAGMLDKSSPDPLLSGGPVVVSNVVRLTEEAARPGETIEIDGKAVHTTRRRAKLLRMVMDQPLTLSAMARAGVSPTVAGMKAQIRDTNADLERAGVTRRVRMQALPPQRRGARGGREPALYALLDPKQEIATPVVLTAVQDEGAAGSNPEQGADDSASGDGDAIAAQSAQFVTLTGEGEGDHHSLVDPSPAAGEELPETADEEAGFDSQSLAESRSDLRFDSVRPGKSGVASPGGSGRPDGGERPAPIPDLAPASAAAQARQPEVVAPPQPSADVVKPASKPTSLKPPTKRDQRQRIEPGDLIAVDVKVREVVTKLGIYTVAGANLARALERLRGGQMFGLDAIAKVAGWPTAEVARTALFFERKRLSEHGIDLYLDKFNVRLREAS